MPILESNASQSAIRRMLLAAGLGAVLGFQSWRVAEHAFGVSIPWYGPAWISAITTGLGVGLLIAFLTDAPFPRARTSTDRGSPRSERASRPEDSNSWERDTDTIRQRLAEEKACLGRLDAERKRRGDLGFGKPTEDKIIWGELLELELQDIDEQVSRICGAAGGGASGRPPASTGTNRYQRKGGRHERNDS